jgi:integrase
MSRQFNGRFRRPVPALSQNFASPDWERADAVVRTVGAAEPPPPRRRYYANAENGMRVSTYSRRGRDEVLDVLRDKAGGSPLVECWHNAAEEGDASLARQALVTPSNQHRAALLSAHKPENQSTPTPADPMQMVLATLQAQAMQAVADGNNGNQALALMAPLLAMVAQQSSQSSGSPPGGVRISDRLDRWLRYAEQRETTRSTIDANLYSMRLFVGVNGNLLLRDITRAHCEKFLDALAVWPRNASKRRDFRNMEVLQVVQKAIRLRERPIDLVTQQKHVERVRTFFSLCEIDGEVRPNLLYRVQLVSRMHKKQKGQHRRPFTREELDLIFGFARPNRVSTPYRFWMPVIAYYTGARVNELAQLYVDDIIKVNGRWLFNIAMDYPGQRIKNRSSRRLIPVHDHLIKLGLLRFVEQAKAWGRTQLFPDVIWGRNGPGETVSRWFAEMVRNDLNITESGQTFHALRNTFIYFATRSKIPLPEFSDLTGHTVYDNVLFQAYVLEQDAEERCAVFDRIKFFPITHPAYDCARYDHVFRRANAEEQHSERIREAFGGTPTI